MLEVLQVLQVRPHLDTGGVVAACQAPAVLHHTVQAGIQRLRSDRLIGLDFTVITNNAKTISCDIRQITI